jgi:hypothetical protein
MPPSDGPFYARIPTLTDSELCNYTTNYARYKAEAVQAALAEMRRRGLHVSKAELAAIERYFTRQEDQINRPFHVAPSQLRLLSYSILL